MNGDLRDKLAIGLTSQEHWDQIDEPCRESYRRRADVLVAIIEKENALDGMVTRHFLRGLGIVWPDDGTRWQDAVVLELRRQRLLGYQGAREECERHAHSCKLEVIHGGDITLAHRVEEALYLAFQIEHMEARVERWVVPGYTFPPPRKALEDSQTLGGS